MSSRTVFAKTPLVLLAAPLLVLICGYAQCRAEVIYYKDGTVVNAKVIYRTRTTLWIKHGQGSVGIDVDKIDRIEDEGGSISKYSVASLIGRLQELIKQKNYDAAQKTCAILLEGSPFDPEIRYLDGLLNQKIGNPGKAAEDYNFLIGNDAATAEVFNNLGTIYAAQKRYESAAAMFGEAIKRQGDRPEFHNNLAEASLQLKDFGRAINEYEKVSELEPSNTRALFNLGVAYKNNGDDNKAREQWERILNINPQDAQAQSALERLGKKGL